MLPHASAGLVIGFIVLPVAMFFGFVWAVGFAARRRGARDRDRRRLMTRAALGLGGIMLVAAALAGAGLLAEFKSFPPRPMPLFLAGLALVFVAAFSRFGTNLAAGLPLALLVGYQAFRIVVELLMHFAASEGVMPPQLSFSGRNFDIVTGVTAIPMAAWIARGRPPRWAVMAWNLLGLGLLLNVLIVAILSMPTPFQVLKPDNTWVAYFPFIWLPMNLVLVALLGHLLVFRRWRHPP